ncbi:MAG: recombination protein O N-terminal domain-containing protein [Candidatus Liptonbacteria bacterium]
MHEYLGRAIVLDLMPRGKSDARVVLFMEKIGKLTARAQSLRKITSKLAAHLQPGNIARVRVIEKGKLVQVVDALKTGKAGMDVEKLRQLSGLLAENQPEIKLWQEAAEDGISWRNILKLLGWDPDHAACRVCGHLEVASFHPQTQDFFCGECSSQLDVNELIFMQ